MGHQNPFRLIEVDWKARALAAKPAEPKFGSWVDIMSRERRLYTRALWHLCAVSSTHLLCRKCKMIFVSSSHPGCLLSIFSTGCQCWVSQVFHFLTAFAGPSDKTHARNMCLLWLELTRCLCEGRAGQDGDFRIGKENRSTCPRTLQGVSFHRNFCLAFWTLHH